MSTAIVVPLFQPDSSLETTQLNVVADAVNARVDQSQVNSPLGVAPLDDLGYLPLANINITALAQALSTAGPHYNGVLTLTDVTVNKVFQRDTRTAGGLGFGAGNVPIAVNMTAATELMEYRVINASTLAIVQDWAVLGTIFGPGAMTFQCLIPASVQPLLIAFRANGDNSSFIRSANQFYVGEVFAVSGQSLMEAFLSTTVTADPATMASLGVVPAAGGLTFVSYASNGGAFPPTADGPDVNMPPAAWVQPADGTIVNSTGVAEFLRLMVGQADVACAVVGYCVGGSGIASWLPGYTGQPNTGHWTKLVNVLTLAGAKFGSFIWDQGHYETKDGTTSAQYLANIQALRAAITAQFPLSGAFKWIMLTIPGVGNYGNGPAAIEMVRQTAMAYCLSTANSDYVDGIDTTLWTDLVHPSQAGNVIYGRHIYRAAMNQVDNRTIGDKGPLITAATRAYGTATIKLAISQVNSGNALVTVGAFANQFQVFNQGQTTGALAISSVTVISSSEIDIVLSVAPAGAALLDVWYRLPPDTSTIIGAGIYDNVVDSGDGLTVGRQLQLVAVPVSATSPAVALTVNTIANPNSGGSMSIVGGYTNGTPSLLQYSFDGVTWVNGTGQSISGGAYNFTATAPVAGGPATMQIRDATTLGSVTSNIFIVSTNTILVNTISSQIAAASLAVAGTYFGFAPAALDYSADSGATWVAASSPTIGGGTYSFTISAGLSVGEYALLVRDHSTLSQGASNAFAVNVSSPPVLPTITGLMLKIDASTPAAHLYTDTALSAPAVMGQAVAGILDLSGTANNFTQATIGKAPFLVANAKNSMPGLRFTGSLQQFMALVAGAPLFAAMNASAGYTANVVFTPASTPSPTASDVFQIGLSTSGNAHSRIGQFLVSGATRFSRGTDTSSPVASVNGVGVTNTLVKMVGRYDGAGLTLKNAINALTEVVNTTGITAPPAISEVYDECRLGGDFSGSAQQFWLDGWIHELEIWNSLANDTQRTSLLTYNTSKWGS